MSDAIVSLIRTIVPVIVGLVLAGLIKLGIEVDETALATVFDGLLIGLYYALARWLESKWPSLGWLLGAPKQPTYQP
jgi:hypothetical protein